MNRSSWVKVMVALLLGVGGLMLGRQAAAKSMDFLKTQGEYIVDQQGKPIKLRGVNLGSWLLIEPWINFWPENLDGQRATEKDIWDTWYRRFGQKKTKELMNVYRENFLTENDFRYLNSIGVNFVRIPIGWRALVDEKYGAADGFRYLDQVIAWCKKNRIYCLIDLHGAPGGQSDDVMIMGENTKNQFWSNEEYVQRTMKIWEKIAQRYKNEPAVAGYDLLNEAWGAPSILRLAEGYDQLYQSIRRVDPRHIVFIEDALQGLGRLPKPAVMQWTNVVYSVHIYPNNMEGSEKIIKNDLSNLRRAQHFFGVPLHVGEFNSIQRDRGGAEYIRKFTRVFDGYGWAWNLWTYKKVDENFDVNWGVKTLSPKKLPAMNYEQITYEDLKKMFLAYRTGFQPMPQVESAIKEGATDAIIKMAAGTAGKNLVLSAETATVVRSANGELQLEWQSQPPALVLWKSNDSVFWNVAIPADGIYALSLNAAAKASGSRMDLLIDQMEYAEFKIKSTGGWDDYQELPLGQVSLKKGVHRIKLYAAEDLGGAFVNLRSLILKPGEKSKAILAPKQSKIELTPFENMQMERKNNISVEWQNNPPNFGHWSKGDRVQWRFQVLSAGTYNLHLLYSTPTSDVKVMLKMNGVPLPAKTLPVTGQWHDYRKLELGFAEVKTGINILEMECESPSGNDAGNFQSVTLLKP